MFALTGIETYLRLGVVGVLLLLVGYGEYKVYEMGYHSAQTRYEAQLAAIKAASDAEQLKEAKANSDALKATGDAITKLEDETDDTKQDAADAAKDVNAKRPALGVASVRRLNHLSSN